MRFEELNWMDIENYLKQDDRLILVLGACEQHGYLSLLTDALIPQALADAASTKTGVLVAPALNFGCSPYFLAYPGTISLRAATLMDAAEDIIRSVYGCGFRRLLVLNGHSGNHPVRIRLNELGNALPGLNAAWYEWWESPRVEAIARKYALKPAHANWMEAFPFTQVAEFPENEKAMPEGRIILSAEQFRQTHGDGSFGGVYKADPAVMDELFAACLEEVLDLLAWDR